jgi:Ca-activated chloride channel family protein
LFENPSVLLFLLIVLVMLGVYLWRDRVRRQRLQQLASNEALAKLIPEQSSHSVNRHWRFALWSAMAAALIVALARPVFGVDAEVVETRGLAIVVALDVSASMDAQDLLPSRMERAKLAIRDLFSGADGNLFGLVLFAGDAFVQVPLTSDLDSALTFVDAASSRSISRQGTAIEDALRLSLASFDERISSASIIVLMTDGENQIGDPVAAAQNAADSGATVHVLGFGTKEGDVIPVFDASGRVIEYKTDQGNNLVVSQLNTSLLESIAEAGSGTYQQVSASGVEVVNLQNTIAKVEAELLATRYQTRPVPRFEIFVALALLLLTGDILLQYGGLSLPSRPRTVVEEVNAVETAEAADAAA